MTREHSARLQIRAVLVVYRWERRQREAGKRWLSDEDWEALVARCIQLLDATEQGFAQDGTGSVETLAELRAARAEVESGAAITRRRSTAPRT